MANAIVVYGSTTGNTERAAKKIAKKLGIAEVKNITDLSASDFEDYDQLILGTSTWDEGELQEDWVSVFEDLDDVDLSDKTIALFGLGDQDAFGQWFVSGIGKIYRKVLSRGARVVGFWPTDGYDFQDSEGVESGKFVGLALDDDNQEDMTDDRIAAWCEQIKGDFS